MQAATAIKVGEYLLCGLPVIATDGVGDRSTITPHVGFTLNESSNDRLEEAAAWFTGTVLPAREEFRARCREVGLEHHSLESSVGLYLQALGNLCP
jgi:glycosyltransferase involved in cell wall biosynthesis